MEPKKQEYNFTLDTDDAIDLIDEEIEKLEKQPKSETKTETKITHKQSQRPNKDVQKVTPQKSKPEVINLDDDDEHETPKSKHIGQTNTSPMNDEMEIDEERDSTQVTPVAPTKESLNFSSAIQSLIASTANVNSSSKPSRPTTTVIVCINFLFNIFRNHI